VPVDDCEGLEEEEEVCEEILVIGRVVRGDARWEERFSGMQKPETSFIAHLETEGPEMKRIWFVNAQERQHVGKCS
jgi:hypothetical protein